MAKKFQALKFSEGLENDLKMLASIKNVNYNAYVEGILSSHVLIQKRAMRAATEDVKSATRNEDANDSDVSAVDGPSYN